MPRPEIPFSDRIISVSPADGWYALFDDPDEKTIGVWAVACWVAVKPVDAKSGPVGVLGLTCSFEAAELTDCESAETFMEYRHRSELKKRLAQLEKERGLTLHPSMVLDLDSI